MNEFKASVSAIPIVGAIGSGGNIGEQTPMAEQAKAVGRIVAEAGCSLLTGGGGGVMSVVSQAFVESPFRTGRSIAVVPGDVPGIETASPGVETELNYSPKVGYPNEWVEIPLFTHLPGDRPKGAKSRNYINVLTSDVVVALAGQSGTAAELEIAAQLKKPVIALLNDDQSIGQYSRDELPRGVSNAKNFEDVERFIETYTVERRSMRPSFNDLRGHYKTDPTQIHECSISFPNTCAIRMSEALAAVMSDIIQKFRSSGRNVCPHGYMRGAQDLAAVLRQADVFGRYEYGFEAPGKAPDAINGVTGLVCYMNIPSYPDGQGHIDLWHGSEPIGEAYWMGNPVWFWRL